MGIKGSCHCGATQFEVSAAPATVTKCTCSFCSKRGGLWAYYSPEDFKLLTARDRVSTYQWGTYTGQHHHCAICGCGTYSEFPDFSSGEPDFDNPKVTVNSRLFDDFDLGALEVITVDGKNLW
jgi:hypothetical protein